MPNSPDGPQNEGPGARSKKKRQSESSGTKETPAMPSTASALELEQELEAIQKGQTVAQLKETLLIESMCHRGHSLLDICEELNYLRVKKNERPISYASLVNLKKRFPESFPTDAWREDAIGQAERSLFQLVSGNAMTIEERPVTVSDGKDAGEHVEIHRFTKRHAPDIKAVTYFLNNRDPARWQEKTKIALDRFGSLSDDELLALTKEALQTGSTTQNTDEQE